MGVFDGFLNMMRLGPDDDDDFYDDGYEDEVEEKPKASARTIAKNNVDMSEPDPVSERRSKEKTQNKITPMRSSSRRSQTSGGMEVCVIKPTTFDESREITETLLANRTVVLNVEGLDVDIAQRIIEVQQEFKQNPGNRELLEEFVKLKKMNMLVASQSNNVFN